MIGGLVVHLALRPPWLGTSDRRHVRRRGLRSRIAAVARFTLRLRRTLLAGLPLVTRFAFTVARLALTVARLALTVARLALTVARLALTARLAAAAGTIART
ncbi:hypothetical protein, partial [Bradyrhizobium elkanii]|uniref:hypothetical protein n=1 Tax=Bradyrhizobium elkanii TaxID=29448 RepID=UPI001476D9AB